MNDNDLVNHPKHYTQKSHGIECIEITRYMSFSLGNAFKYLWRHAEKEKPIEDLEKAIWYLKDAKEYGSNSAIGSELEEKVYTISNEDELCGDILYNIFYGNTATAISAIKELIEKYKER